MTDTPAGLDEKGLQAARFALGDAISWGCEPTDALGSVISAYLSALPQAPALPAEGVVSDWRDDPSADDRWCAGLDYGQTQLCHALGVDPQAVNWDAATETLDGDVQSVIGNILCVKFGDDWSALVPAQPALEKLPCDVQLPGVKLERGVSMEALLLALRRHANYPEDRQRLPAQPAGGEVVDIVPTGFTATTLVFSEGVLHVSKDGSGYIAVDEDQFQLEDDRCEGPDGPEGSVHWITRFPPGELAALRDFLNGAKFTHPAPSGDAVREALVKARDALCIYATSLEGVHSSRYEVAKELRNEAKLIDAALFPGLIEPTAAPANLPKMDEATAIAEVLEDLRSAETHLKADGVKLVGTKYAGVLCAIKDAISVLDRIKGGAQS